MSLAPLEIDISTITNCAFPAPEYIPQNSEACLENFRTAFIKHMPFLVIPPFITAHQLRKERSIL